MIEEFQGEYRWLSNFVSCSIMLNGIMYRSVEHAYMSAKSDNIDWKEFCQNTEKPGAVKKASYSLAINANWNKYKKHIIMWQCLQQKYRQEPYMSKLIATDDTYIQEGNNHNDDHWGFCFKKKKGLNILGHMIMDIREELIAELNDNETIVKTT